MKLSTRSRYAVMAMIDLAQQEGVNGPSCVPISLIARRQGLPSQYIEQLFSRLRKRDLIKSTRGINGGYALARSANDIRIYDIILAADKPVKVVRCSAKTTNGCHTSGKRCNSHQLWYELELVMHGYLAQISLSDVISGRNHHPNVVLSREESR